MKFVPMDERETTINIYRTDETAYIYTSDDTMITKLNKLSEKNPDRVKASRPDEYGMKYTMPKSWIGFRPNRIVILSEEQKEAKRAILKRAKAAQAEKNKST